MWQNSEVYSVTPEKSSDLIVRSGSAWFLVLISSLAFF